MPRMPSGIRAGFAWAACAAIAFGVTTPLVAHLTAGTGSWFAAGWLYLGAAGFALAAQRNRAELIMGFSANWRLLLAIALIGGMLAPAAYVVGVHASGALASSLALNMEAPFSVAYAAIVFREYIGRRVLVAMLAIVAGASVMVFDRALPPALNAGALFVILATALWAIDNGLSARLQGLDPRITVFWKSLIGALLSLSIAAALRESAGTPQTIFLTVAVGAIGYGASLVCYLIAQQRFGVARTASVFASAPFIGALAAIAAHDARFDAGTALAMLLMLAGVVLHATEGHAHVHRHVAEEHTHPHSHDDLHHGHAHQPPVIGEHTHAHRHRELVHAHDHSEDAAHRHEH